MNLPLEPWLPVESENLEKLTTEKLLHMCRRRCTKMFSCSILYLSQTVEMI